MNKIIISIVILTIYIAIAGAVPEMEWEKTYGGTEIDMATSIVQTSDGYVFTGHTYSYDIGGADVWLVKTNVNGDDIWNRTYGGTKRENAFSLQQTTDDGFIIAGTTRSYGSGNEDFWLVKTDANGIEEWNETYGGTDFEEARSVRQTKDGGYIVTGYKYLDEDIELYDALLIKTNSNGIEEWNQTFIGTKAFSVQQTNDDGYVIGGYKGTDTDWDVILIKTDSNGIEEWNKTFGGSNDDRAYSVIQTADGGYIITGHTDINSGDVWLIKTDPDGIEEWNKTYGDTTYSEEGIEVQQIPEEGYIISGFIQGYMGGNGFIVKAKQDGTEEWIINIGGSGYDGLAAVHYTPYRDYIFAGHTMSYGAGITDAWLLKFKEQKREGSVSISVIPRNNFVVKGFPKQIDIKVKNNENMFDSFLVYIDSSEIPTIYRADIGWFDWTEKTIGLPAGGEFTYQINVTVPSDVGGNTLRVFRAKAQSLNQSSIYSYNSGYLRIITPT